MGACLLSQSVETLTMAFVLPTAKCELNINPTEQGLIIAVAFLGILLTSHFWGFLTDTWGRKKVLQVALLSTLICSIISSFSVSTIMLMLSRFCVGLL